MNKSIVPCALTSMNLVSGFMAIIVGIKGNIGLAVLLIMLAAFFDSIDGRVAYMLNAASELGKELDSFADLISFGMAPALILHYSFSQCNFVLPYISLIIPVIYLLCGTFRLARYNVLNIKDYFVGLPIPVAGFAMVVSCYYIRNIGFCWITVITLLLSFFMVSTIKLPRLKLNLLKR